jgi:hypothetical protein
MSTKSTPEVFCPVCKESTARRVNRDGFLQRKVLVIFGMYPWKCGACGSTFLYRRRGLHPQSSSHRSQSVSASRKQKRA